VRHPARLLTISAAALPLVALACGKVLGIEEVGYGAAASDSGVTQPDASSSDAPSGADGPICGKDELACGGTCTAIQTSPIHCGRCGHDCGGGTCTEGACDPIALGAVDPLVEKPHGLVLGADVVYFTTYAVASPGDKGGRVLSVPKKGGGLVSEIAKGEGLPSYLTILNDRLFWTSWTLGELRSAEITAGGVNGVTTRGSTPGISLFGITTDGSGVFVTMFTSNQVGRFEPSGDAGASPTAITSGEEEPRMLTTDGTNLYWSNLHAIRARAISGGAVRDVVKGLQKGWSVNLRGGYLYYSDNVLGTIGRVKDPQSDPPGLPEPMADGFGGVKVMAVDDTAAYAGDQGKGRVMRVETTPPFKRSVVASGQQGPVAVALDDKFVYWVNSDDGRVMKAAK